MTINISLDLDLMDFKVIKLLCEDKFDDSATDTTNCVTDWDIDDEKQMKEVKRLVMDKDYGRTFDKLIELTRVTDRNLRSMLERFRIQKECHVHEMRSVRMDEIQ